MKSLSIGDKLLAVFSIIAIVVAGVIGFSHKTKIAEAFGNRYMPDQTIASTSAPYQTFLPSGSGVVATTTVNTDGYQDLTLFTSVGSSTTPPTITYRVQYSPFVGIDCVANQNACVWYDADSILNSSATTTVHVSGGAIDSFVYSSTTANQSIFSGSNNVKFMTKKIVITGLDSTFTRVLWTSSVNAILNVIPSVKNTYIIPK